VSESIDDAIARARRVGDHVRLTLDGVAVRVFPSDEVADVRHRLRSESMYPTT